jgi:hypothetical protein
MEETKIALPAWLPWATTACLAAMVACLVELWVIEKSRYQLLKEESLLAESEMKAMDNQLAAERIVHRREMENLKAATEPRGTLQVVLLEPVGPGAAPTPGPACGVVIWDPSDGTGRIRLAGAQPQGPERDYQLWILGPGPLGPKSCGIFHAVSAHQEAEIRIEPALASAPGPRFFLVEVAKGGAQTLEDAESHGPIVLASAIPAGRIPHP